MSFYAVQNGRIPGIYLTWNECEAQVKGFSNARYKKFTTKNEALEFLDPKSVTNNIEKSKSKPKERKLSDTSKKLNEHLDESEDDEQDEPIQKQMKQTLDTKISFNFNDEIVSVYTDGACSQNGKKGAIAGVGVFWGVSHPLNVSRKLIGKQTNNRAEITAAIVAISQAIEYKAKELNLYTDSQFMINCMTKWIQKWKSNNWKTGTGESVKNIPDLKHLDTLCSKIKVNWNYVTAHKGIFENEEADRLARMALQ